MDKRNRRAGRTNGQSRIGRSNSGTHRLFEPRASKRLPAARSRRTIAIHELVGFPVNGYRPSIVYSGGSPVVGSWRLAGSVGDWDAGVSSMDSPEPAPRHLGVYHLSQIDKSRRFPQLPSTWGAPGVFLTDGGGYTKTLGGFFVPQVAFPA